jgi:hypothetical protein
MKFYFAQLSTVPHKPNDSAEDFRRILQLDGAASCFQKRELWRFSMLMRENILEVK